MTDIKLIEINGSPTQKKVTLRMTYDQGEALLTIPAAEPLFLGESTQEIAQRSLDVLLDALEEWEASLKEIE